MKTRSRTRFRAVVVVRMLLLIATVIALAFGLVTTKHFAVPVILIALTGLQVASLLQHVEAHVNTLEEFFATIDHEDFISRFVTDDVDIELKRAFNRILERFQQARADRDVQANYLDTVVRHVPIPFLAARDDGSLSLVNPLAKRLTGLSRFSHINDLASLDPQLPEFFQALKPGQQQLVQTKIRGVPAELRVSVSEFRMNGQTERLYAIENMSDELTARESSAWRNLIRVLTHEIMNTLTPVTSLAQTCHSMLEETQATEDIRDAVSTIARRSEGLMKFVSKYRELLHIPKPNPETFSVTEAFHSIATLLRDELADINLSVDVSPESLEVLADRDLLDQLLLNLIKNAADSLVGTDEPSIELKARLDFGRVHLTIRDNGAGIADNIIDDIFIPFFTTKRDGSGIGLSLCRQIMTAHGGEIAVESSPDGTLIRVIF